jgi:hypothetical protein
MLPTRKNKGLVKRVVVPYAPSFVTGSSNKPWIKKTVDPSKIKQTGLSIAPGATLVKKVKKAKGLNLSQAIKENVSKGLAQATTPENPTIGGGAPVNDPQEENKIVAEEKEPGNKTPWGMIIAVVLVFAGIAIYSIKK